MPTPKQLLFIAVFIAIIIACLIPLPWVGPPLALAIGIVFALTNLSEYQARAKVVSRFLIQACIVMLGLRIDLAQLVREAQSGFVFAAATILAAFMVGFTLERLLRTGKELTLLISSGTAICGGSAIAAVGTSIGASGSSMAVATGVIFILNAVALYAFPPIGHWLSLTDAQFGTWAGVAIHDISSVVGAATNYHATGDAASSTALDTANIVKLSRVIWIFPCTLFAAWVMRRSRAAEALANASEVANTNGSTPANSTTKPVSPATPTSPKNLPARIFAIIPPFILLFLLASAARTFIPALAEHQGSIKWLAGAGFAAALFLIGSGLSKKALASVGWRALVQALITWLVMAVGALLIIKYI